MKTGCNLLNEIVAILFLVLLQFPSICKNNVFQKHKMLVSCEVNGSILSVLYNIQQISSQNGVFVFSKTLVRRVFDKGKTFIMQGKKG